jgi:hypothetical protein
MGDPKMFLGDVIYRAGVFYAERSGHEESLEEFEQKSKSMDLTPRCSYRMFLFSDVFNLLIISFGRVKECSQNRSTFQPSRRSLRLTSFPLALFLAIFLDQYSTLDFGFM